MVDIGDRYFHLGFLALVGVFTVVSVPRHWVLGCGHASHRQVYDRVDVLAVVVLIDRHVHDSLIIVVRMFLLMGMTCMLILTIVMFVFTFSCPRVYFVINGEVVGMAYGRDVHVES